MGKPEWLLTSLAFIILPVMILFDSIERTWWYFGEPSLFFFIMFLALSAAPLVGVYCLTRVFSRG